MPRYEITGGNGYRENLEKIAKAIFESGGKRVSFHRAFGMPNQPKVVTFFAENDLQAVSICNVATENLWPNDSSIFANLIPYPYTSKIDALF